MKKSNYKLTPDATRKLVIDYVKANGGSDKTYADVLTNFHVKWDAAHRMVAANKKNGRTDRIKHTGMKRVYDKSDRLTLRNLSAAHRRWSLSKLLRHFGRIRTYAMSKSTASRILIEYGLKSRTCKKM